MQTASNAEKYTCIKYSIFGNSSSTNNCRRGGDYMRMSEKEYHKQYNKKRNKTIHNLQKMKSYYKKIGNFEKMKTCQILIDIEKRKMEV